MKLLAVAILCALLTLFGLVRLALGADVVVAWDPSPSPAAAVAGYRIHYGTNSGSYQFVSSFPQTNRTGQITMPAEVRRWYFAATAVGTNSAESSMSNEVSVDTPPAAPQITRLTGPTAGLILQSASGPAGPWKTLAVITSTNPPLQLKAAGKQFFRTISTNLPPLPR